MFTKNEMFIFMFYGLFLNLNVQESYVWFKKMTEGNWEMQTEKGLI